MKIAIGYPPIESPKGVPLLSQNRQFQWFAEPTYVYPMVPAYAATLLAHNGYDVVWLDGIAEGWTYQEWVNRLRSEQVDFLLMETKTPVVKTHWRIVTDLTFKFPHMKIVLCGDHVTALPYETLISCPVSGVIVGGHYDWGLLGWMNAKRENGIWESPSDINLDDLPMVDRKLTRWELYAEKNGNFKYKPGTYVYSGRDCWWGKCTFCVWDQVLYPRGTFRVHSTGRMLDEVGRLIQLGVKEVFDDCGTFTPGVWLRRFCDGMIRRGYSTKIKFGCNMKPGRLTEREYHFMAEAGFRFILYGVESANQKTLDRLKKGGTAEEMERDFMCAKKAGLQPHITVMIGYPWEDWKDTQRTVDFAKKMLQKGWVDTLQGTIVVPYPGTVLFAECKRNGFLLTEDWDRYDMRESVMRCGITNEQAQKAVRQLYAAFLGPKFMIRKALGVRTLADVKYLYQAGKKVLGHMVDFRKGKD
mgnify:CR=1 FL=1